MNNVSISRRKFAGLIGIGAAAAIVRPRFSLATTASESPVPSGVVRISYNENPYGPSAKGVQAIRDAIGFANRYPIERNDPLVEALASANGVAKDQIILGDGSDEVLKLCAETFTGPAVGKLVAADPVFESILNHARQNGAEVVKIPLTSDFSHDLDRMGSVKDAGLIYICNPNNPTGSITPKNRLREFITKTSPKTIVLVDEAYFHYADAPEYETVIPLIKDHPNLIVTRTFSKIYGMAGMRCGFGIGQRETIARVRPHEPMDSVNVLALAAATASLQDPAQVTNGRTLNTEARAFSIGELAKLGFNSIPSQANFFMVDVKRPVTPLIAAMRQHNVMVGRLFPAMPNHMRVSVGKKTEMETFVEAFRQVVAA